IMMDAKPRMLVNLDWLKSRDDLRLLSSIKYGVSGTSMTPWGDLTNSLQRLQLVMYIRSLSQESTLRGQLTEGLYYAFAKTSDEIESSRMAEYALLESSQKQLAELKKQIDISSEQDQSPKGIEVALEKYKQQLILSASLKQHEANDKKLLDLKKLIKRVEDIYKEIGLDLLRTDVNPSDWDKFIAILRSNAEQRNLSDKNKVLIQQIISSYDNKVIELQQEKKAILGKIASSNRAMELKELDARINTYTKTKHKLLTGFEEIKQLYENEKALQKEVQSKEKN
ncbi:MAG: hypothetical protein H0X29_07310, partial [Parachlamydiaceae bacterium]|nr:hypothetical protein [Parachlamydiaceae bacterium]